MFDPRQNPLRNPLAGLDLQMNSLPASELEALSQFGLGAQPSQAPGLGVSPPPPVDFSMWQKLFGGTAGDGTKIGGVALPGLQALGSLGNAWMGMQNYGLAKDSLKEGKRQFDMNFGAQRDSINTQYEDRQRARAAADPNAIPVDEYMARNRIR